MTREALTHEPPPTAPPRAAKPRGFVRRHWKGLTLATVVILPLAAIALWVTTTLAYTYSSGTRTGYNQKLSRKGWVCKTWEGELAMVAVPGSMPEKFYFTVRNDSIAGLINTALGKRVALTYRQHVGVPTSCFGDTEYYVGDVKVLE